MTLVRPCFKCAQPRPNVVLDTDEQGHWQVVSNEDGTPHEHKQAQPEVKKSYNSQRDSDIKQMHKDRIDVEKAFIAELKGIKEQLRRLADGKGYA